MTTLSLTAKIEALLFYKNESVTIAWLAKALGEDKEAITTALRELEAARANTGIVLQRNGEEIALKTSPEAASLIEACAKDEIAKELTPSALETLSIIMYRGPLPKKEIDYIRGVNSGFILRNLLIRGLIEKQDGAGGSVLYKPTMDLMSLLGLQSIEDLEEYTKVREELEQFNKQDTHVEADRT